MDIIKRNMFSLNKDIALLYGILLGDGSLSLVRKNMKFITISSCIHDDMPFVQKIISPLLEKITKRKIKYKLRPKNGVIEFNFTNAKLFDYLHSLGFPIGKKGPDLQIPKIFYEKNLLKEIIQGYIATDGSLVLTKNPNLIYPRVEASSISKKLMRQILEIINQKEIKCNLYKRKTKKHIGLQQYRIQSNGRKNLKMFLKEFGFINPKHSERLKKVKY